MPSERHRTVLEVKALDKKRLNMRAERIKHGLSIRQVADIVGMHPNSLMRWESGEADPLAINLVKLSKLYGCSPEYLLGMTEDRDGREEPSLTGGR